MIVKWIRNALAAAVLMAGAFAAHGATLQLDIDQRLLGIQGVNVNGALYDVTFQDGSCDSLFGGCSSSNFSFTTLDEANAASQALLDLIGLDADGAADATPDPTYIVGCDSYTLCTVITPHIEQPSDGYTWVARFQRPNMVNYLDIFVIAASADTGSFDFATYAVWSKATVVPEPVSLALFGIGALAATAMRRRKQPKV